MWCVAVQDEQEQADLAHQAEAVMARLVDSTPPGCHLPHIATLALEGPLALRGTAAVALAKLIASIGEPAGAYVSTLMQLLQAGASLNATLLPASAARRLQGACRVSPATTNQQKRALASTTQSCSLVDAKSVCRQATSSI